MREKGLKLRETRKAKRRPDGQMRGPFESEKVGWHACPKMRLTQWLKRGETCGECMVEDEAL